MARVRNTARQKREDDRRVAANALRGEFGDAYELPAFRRAARFIADRVSFEARRPRREYPDLPYRPPGGLSHAIKELHVDPILDILHSIPSEMVDEVDNLHVYFHEVALTQARATFPNSTAPFGQMLLMLMVKAALQAVLDPDIQHASAIRETTHAWMPEVRRRAGLPPIIAGGQAE